MDEREAVARAIYAKRPFCLGCSQGVVEGVGIARAIPWKAAPAYYQNDCLEIADAAIAALRERAVANG